MLFCRFAVSPLNYMNFIGRSISCIVHLTSLYLLIKKAYIPHFFIVAKSNKFSLLKFRMRVIVRPRKMFVTFVMRRYFRFLAIPLSAAP